MNTPILYLDLLILSSAVFPAGFSNSLFTSWKGIPQRVSTDFLLLLALPYPVIVLAVWTLRPDLLVWRGPTVPLIALAVLLGPVALLIEYYIHVFASYRKNRRLTRGPRLQQFWRNGFSVYDHFLLAVIAIGEEVVYRGVWFSIVLSWGFSAPTAVVAGSVAYGINHFAFGRTAIISKTVTGVLYGALYVLGGRSIWLPIISHILQNTLLFVVARERHA
jgi:membrane protease YdiL (CAAX protease family)